MRERARAMFGTSVERLFFYNQVKKGKKTRARSSNVKDVVETENAKDFQYIKRSKFKEL